MRKTRKAIVTAFVALLMLGILVSCGGSKSEKFEIEGKWKSVGSYGFGQAQPGNIISFDGVHCNFFSPMDTYTVRNEDGEYYLDTTSLLGDTLTFSIDIVDNNNIKLTRSDNTTELQRVN